MFTRNTMIAAAFSNPPGQWVAACGKVDGLMMNVLLSECTIE